MERSSGGWVWQCGQGQTGMETEHPDTPEAASEQEAESQTGLETNET